MNVITRQNPDGLEIVEYDRQFFLENVWEYNPGERIYFSAPSGSGKTTFGFQLLEATVTPKIVPVVLVMKPRDETATKWSKGLGYKVLRTWPPRRSLWDPKDPAGWTLWPEEVDNDHTATLIHQREVFLHALNDIYNFHKRQKRRKKADQIDGMIVFADELQGIDDELKMHDQVVRFYSRGRSNDAGMWGASQRPFEVAGVVYSSSDHLFLAYDPDERDRKRFGEIGGGIDPKVVEEVTLRLKQFEWLYLRRSDRTMCIVSA